MAEVKVSNASKYVLGVAKQHTQSTVVWNMKGGVGKTTTTFMLAEKSRSPRRVFIDLDPQCSLTRLLMGSQFVDRNAESEATSDTSSVLHYFLKVANLIGSDHYQQILSLKPYLVKVTHAKFKDTDTWILPGSFRLPWCDGDLHVKSITRGLMGEANDSWLAVYYSLRESMAAYGEEYPTSEFFVNTQPSCAITTIIGLCACAKLVVPIPLNDELALHAMHYIGLVLYDTDGTKKSNRIFGIDFLPRALELNWPFFPRLDHIYVHGSDSKEKASDFSKCVDANLVKYFGLGGHAALVGKIIVEDNCAVTPCYES